MSEYASHDRLLYWQAWWLASGVHDAASVKTAITLHKGVCLNISALEKMTKIWVLVFWSDSLDIKDWALSLSPGRGYVVNRQERGAKYMASSLGFIIHEVDPLSYLLHLFIKTRHCPCVLHYSVLAGLFQWCDWRPSQIWADVSGFISSSPPPREDLRCTTAWIRLERVLYGGSVSLASLGSLCS